jgi:hypothetical protein
VKEGAREYSAFAYDNAWLSNPARFEVSPDLALVSGHQVRRAPTKIDLCFHHATWLRRMMPDLPPAKSVEPVESLLPWNLRIAGLVDKTAQ